MSLAKHVRLLVLATLAWAAFWVLGLPLYYQQYSTWTMAGLSAALLAVLVLALPRSETRPLLLPERNDRID